MVRLALDYRETFCTPLSAGPEWWWTDTYLPFAITGGGNLFCVDLGGGGVFYHAHNLGPHESSYRGFGDWLGTVAMAIEKGQATVGEGGIRRREPAFIHERGLPRLG
jgi:hypothetical protein